MTQKWIGWIGVIFLTAALAAAQPAARESDWKVLKSLSDGTHVHVVAQDGKFTEGNFAAWSPTWIEVVSDNAIVKLRSEEVRRVTVERKSSRWKGALVGALVGFGIGFPIGAASAGYITDRNDPGFATRAGMGTGVGMFAAGIAAPVGALLSGKKTLTVFRAKDSRATRKPNGEIK